MLQLVQLPFSYPLSQPTFEPVSQYLARSSVEERKSSAFPEILLARKEHEQPNQRTSSIASEMVLE